jgi:hypothetical protein
VSTRQRHAAVTNDEGAAISQILRSRQPIAIRQNFADCAGEFAYASAWYNDGVATPMRFFSDSQKLSAIVLSQFDVEIFAFDLKLPRLDDVIHVQSGRDSAHATNERKAIFECERANKNIFALSLRINLALPSRWAAFFALIRERKVDLALE